MSPVPTADASLCPQGVPEDLLFFYEHLRKGGGVVRVDRSLLMYRYHPAAATHAVLEYVSLGSGPAGPEVQPLPQGGEPGPRASISPGRRPRIRPHLSEQAGLRLDSMDLELPTEGRAAQQGWGRTPTQGTARTPATHLPL